MFSVVLALMLQPVTVAANASNTASVQPAVDVITRNFGAAAAAVFNLKLLDEGTACEVADEDGVTVSSAKAPCFAITQTGGKLTVSASSMSELTYGIGHYARYTCGKCPAAAPAFLAAAIHTIYPPPPPPNHTCYIACATHLN